MKMSKCFKSNTQNRQFGDDGCQPPVLGMILHGLTPSKITVCDL